jgi:hypothetical protein
MTAELKSNERIMGSYLEDYDQSYSILLTFIDEDMPGVEVLDLMLRRAGYDVSVTNLINKQFIAVGYGFPGVLVVYVYDHTYQLCRVHFDCFKKFLERRYSASQLR